MDRRQFIKNSLYSAAAVSASTSSLFTFTDAFAANGPGTVSPRVVINLMLLGGADQRFLFVPQPGSAYANKFWEKRKTIYRYNAETQALYNSYDDVWNDLYLATEFNGMTFGIHKEAAWLQSQFVAGNVAIVANMVASENRRHDHSQLIMHTGDVTTSLSNLDRNGWGGRFVAAGNSTDNVVCMSRDVSPFCNGSNPGNRLENVVHVRDSRNFALPVADAGNLESQRNVMARALVAYYKERGIDVEQEVAAGNIPEKWPFRRFFKHEQAIRKFGDSFKQRLDNTVPTLPYYLSRLTGNSSTRLSNRSFAQQIINLHDSLIGADILRLKSAYIEYGSWDTHKRQKIVFERNIKDLYGFNGGLSSLYSSLAGIQGATENLSFVITSDFGRQLAANGDNGTDHGEGTYGILIGNGVNGGVSGEMFPQSEVTPDPTFQNKTRFDRQGTDIEGRTSFEWVLGAACDWATPGSGQNIFTRLASATPPKLEAGVNPATLFNPGHAAFGNVTLARNGVPIHRLQRLNIVATGANNNANPTTTTLNGHFRVNSLVDGSYTLNISHPYMTFSPATISLPIRGADVYDLNFSATPSLHLFYTKKYTYTDTATGEVRTRLILAGHNFIPDATTVTVGGVVGTIFSLYDFSSGTAINLDLVGTAPPTGAIVITTTGTNPETYTHDVLVENIT